MTQHNRKSAQQREGKNTSEEKQSRPQRFHFKDAESRHSLHRQRNRGCCRGNVGVPICLWKAERKIGQLTLENEVLRAAAEKRGLQIPPAKRPR